MKPKVLLSAYACFDGYGSEPGVGYNWLQEIVRSGKYDILLCTSGWSFESLKNDDVIKNIEILTLGSYKNDQRFRKNRLVFQIYLLVWQFRLLLKLLGRKEKFDIAHHLTFGGITIPSFIFIFGKKSIYGPVGGSEKAPMVLTQSSGIGLSIKERFKSISVMLAKFDPFLIITKNGFDKILLKNKDNTHFYKSVYTKLKIKPEICFIGEHLNYEEVSKTSIGVCIFAARGIYWKGGSIAIDVIEQFNLHSTETLQLNFYGDGNQYSNWKQKAHGNPNIYFHGRVNREELWKQLKRADFLIFPSFHDSSGNAILEALCLGVPVLAFDLGGPSSIIEHKNMLINPNQSYQEIVNEFILKAKQLKSLSKEERIKIASFYRKKFSKETLLLGVYK
jgi:glycosyltransferase involved in cell wall biosynthesis